MAVDHLGALIEALTTLPGVGEKSAQRMAYNLLQHQRDNAATLAQCLHNALTQLQACQRCNSFSSDDLCPTCTSPARDPRQLCVVEMPIDQAKLEQTNSYQGLYFVLMGRISPLQGEGHKHIGLEKLLARCSDGVVEEVILATSFTAEGEITAHSIGQTLKPLGIKVTRLARGVPAGAELEYIDAATLAHALWERRG